MRKLILTPPGPEWRTCGCEASEAMWLPDPMNHRSAKVVVLALYGRLKSGRDADFSNETTAQNNSAWSRENNNWFMKVKISGVRAILHDAVETWHREGFKAALTAIVYRKAPLIRDFKNLVVGIDQGVIDGLVHGEVLIDDSMDHIDHKHFGQQQTTGQEYVYLRFERGDVCPDSVRQQAEDRWRGVWAPREVVNPAAVVSALRRKCSRRKRRPADGR